MSFKTAGELVLGRFLNKEHRKGVPHYAPGQHEAYVLLTYVDQMGHACSVPLRMLEGELQPVGYAQRAGLQSADVSELKTYKLSHESKKAIQILCAQLVSEDWDIDE